LETEGKSEAYAMQEGQLS